MAEYEELAKDLVQYCIDHDIKVFNFEIKKHEFEDDSYIAKIETKSGKYEPLILTPCDNCNKIAIHTAEGPNAEYADSLCSNCEST